MTITITDNRPRAWVGCLGCYNNGDLVGRWLEDPDDIREYTCPRPKTIYNLHEELWVFDHENAPWLTGECSPAEFADIAEKYTAALDELDHIPAEAIAAYLDNYHNDVDWDTLADDLNDRYAGVWPSLEAYAYDLAKECGFDDDGPYANYVDFAAVGRDLVLGGDYWVHEAGWETVYVFRSN